jgi:hypothetical protein
MTLLVLLLLSVMIAVPVPTVVSVEVPLVERSGLYRFDSDRDRLGGMGRRVVVVFGGLGGRQWVRA